MQNEAAHDFVRLICPECGVGFDRHRALVEGAIAWGSGFHCSPACRDESRRKRRPGRLLVIDGEERKLRPERCVPEPRSPHYDRLVREASVARAFRELEVGLGALSLS